jgi:hypothetical protein
MPLKKITAIVAMPEIKAVADAEAVRIRVSMSALNLTGCMPELRMM